MLSKGVLKILRSTGLQPVDPLAPFPLFWRACAGESLEPPAPLRGAGGGLLCRAVRHASVREAVMHASVCDIQKGWIFESANRSPRTFPVRHYGYAMERLVRGLSVAPSDGSRGPFLASDRHFRNGGILGRGDPAPGFVGFKNLVIVCLAAPWGAEAHARLGVRDGKIHSRSSHRAI